MIKWTIDFEGDYGYQVSPIVRKQLLEEAADPRTTCDGFSAALSLSAYLFADGVKTIRSNGKNKYIVYKKGFTICTVIDSN
jgi:hypothetical protein